MKKLSVLFIPIFLLLLSCTQEAKEQALDSPENKAQFASFEQTGESKMEDFQSYWYKGQAEISSYKLDQARYGEIHAGHAVLVYVTEDFSKKKQVKLDYAEVAGVDKVPILKLNFTKKFNTGIYPYSILQSTFTPVDIETFPHSLKTTMSMQEWCGHVFTQLNERKDHYQLAAYSYFESEGDVQQKLKKVQLEDDLWTRIRIAPESLPEGKLELIPSLMFSRLRHKPLSALEANLSKKEQGQEVHYTLSYPTERRTLTIVYQKAFPHKILGWEEKYTSGFGAGAKELVTKATLMESMMSDYWSRNSNQDLPLRDKLNLP